MILSVPLGIGFKIENISMKIEKVDIPGLLVLTPDVFGDDRGYFYELHNSTKYSSYGFYEKFVQDNISKSKYGTIRGLHYQTGDSAQGKLCSVLMGKVLDVAVDVRFGSSTFGKYYSIILDDQEKKQFWIPPGFAHGFAVLSESAIFHYKCTANYDKQSERCIIYNDPTIAINWGIENPVVSQKDQVGVVFNQIEKDFIY